MKKGYTEEESIKIVKSYQKKSNLKRTKESYKKMLSPYQKEYWIKKGITDDIEINKKIEEQKIKSNPYLKLNSDGYESMMEKRKKLIIQKQKKKEIL